ncbi:hypothetical protein TNCV_2373431 [Trichonephila clavipes]|nr:hypothetical protein TNCV_2373431 [Trichonephila clavipes]
MSRLEIPPLNLSFCREFEERFSARETQGPNNNIRRRDLDARWRLPDDRRNGNLRDAVVMPREEHTEREEQC